MKTEAQISLSVVVPVYNEGQNIEHLFQEIKMVCESGIDGIPFDYEIIIINDGSTDETDRICRTLKPLTYIRLSKNYGQTSAMDCGFKAATKDYIAALDGDGQNDPADIPMMICYLLDNDLDVVSGWRKTRNDSFGKRFASRGANMLRHLMIHDGINDSGCTLKIYRRECFEDLSLYGEQHRFIPALLKIRGFRIGEVEVHHMARTAGRSKYGLSRIIKGFLDLISVWFWSKYANRPLHLLGGMSLLFFFCGVICAVWTVCSWASDSILTQLGLPLILTVLFLASGVILLALGLVSEMQMRTYYRTSGRNPYIIREKAVFYEDA